MRYLITPTIFIFLLTSATGGDVPTVYVAAPVIHEPGLGISTAFALTNQTFVWSGESASLKHATVELFFIADGEVRTGRRWDLRAGEARYFHTGDVFGLESFSGTVIIMTHGRIGGNCYVRGVGEQLVGNIQKVEVQ